MQVGEVRVAEDADFEKLKNLCQCHDGWKQDYNKNGTTVWSKANDVSSFKMVKVMGQMKDISASSVYDVLHDPQFRKNWDMSMIEGYEICSLNPNNDIGYYALKMPKPLKNRDFITQRSWLDKGDEYLIVNHSVNHASIPPKKSFVRGISYITGYHILPTGGRSDSPGCQVTYVTQSDPKGRLPSWIVNKATQIVAPKVMSRLYKACKSYGSWKSQHNPHHKPWLYPEQNELPRLVLDDIQSMQEMEQAESIDETDITEEEVKDDEMTDGAV